MKLSLTYSAAKTLSLIALLSLGACSTSSRISSSIEPPSKIAKLTDPFALIPTERKLNNTYLYIDDFKDARDSSSLAKLASGSEVAASSDPLVAVSEVLKQGLAKRGFSFMESAPVIISGELTKWSAVQSSLNPSYISAEASFNIVVLDPANKKIYSGSYSGQAQLESRPSGEAELREVLLLALQEAVKQLAMDKRLIDILSVY